MVQRFLIQKKLTGCSDPNRTSRAGGTKNGVPDPKIIAYEHLLTLKNEIFFGKNVAVFSLRIARFPERERKNQTTKVKIHLLSSEISLTNAFFGLELMRQDSETVRKYFADAGRPTTR